MNVRAFGARAADKPLDALEIARREPGAHDVAIDIAYCGVCHSDLHTVRSEWQGTLFPCVPGHEVVGRVSAVGAEVRGFAKGDLVGVGCIVDSCRRCPDCADHLENYCGAMTGTYNFATPDAPGSGEERPDAPARLTYPEHVRDADSLSHPGRSDAAIASASNAP